MGCSEIMRNLGELVMNNKLVTFLSVALFAFVITVIALAVSNNNNASDLDQCREEVARLMLLTSTAAPATTTTEAPTQTTTLSSEVTPASGP